MEQLDSWSQVGDLHHRAGQSRESIKETQSSKANSVLNFSRMSICFVSALFRCKFTEEAEGDLALSLWALLIEHSTKNTIAHSHLP